MARLLAQAGDAYRQSAMILINDVTQSSRHRSRGRTRSRAAIRDRSGSRHRSCLSRSAPLSPQRPQPRYVACAHRRGHSHSYKTHSPPIQRSALPRGRGPSATMKPKPDRDARLQKSHSPPSRTHPQSRSRTPAKAPVQTIDFHGILAFAKQLDGDPLGMGIGPGIDNAHDKWREGAWSTCSACGRQKPQMAFSSSQQRYGTTKRCRILYQQRP